MCLCEGNLCHPFLMCQGCQGQRAQGFRRLLPGAAAYAKMTRTNVLPGEQDRDMWLYASELKIHDL